MRTRVVLHEAEFSLGRCSQRLVGPEICKIGGWARGDPLAVLQPLSLGAQSSRGSQRDFECRGGASADAVAFETEGAAKGFRGVGAAMEAKAVAVALGRETMSE